jgi:prepilin-type N-terminal cleavage/methylation domain-containing protein
VRETRTRVWLLLVAALSCLPVLGAVTTHRIFFVRDLSFFFWSRHLWLRHAIAAGEAPWWDPYVAGGQSAIADALNQLLMPITVAIRLLPSAVVAFNLWVALPLPLAALGMFLFLRRRAGLPGAALGASAFALSGPVVSMLNTPNLSWSVALMPWVLLATDRLEERPSAPRTAVLAAAFALQALCGEPVTWACTGVLAVAYAIFRLKAETTDSKKRELVVSAFRRKTTVVMALAAGALLASAQLVPTALAGIRAHRGTLATPDFWSLHPVALWETVAPHLFGNYYDAFLADLPWMAALNFGRDPFFYSLYVGPLVLLLACAGIAAQFRRNVFWLAILLVFLVAALGGYTPLYPLARRVLPPLMYFRFPVKYIIVSLFACAVLVADGFAAILPSDDGRHAPGRRGGRVVAATAGIAAVGLLVSLALLLMPDLVSRVTRVLSESAHLKDPAAGAVFLARVAPPLLARGSGLLLAGCLFMAVAPRTGLAAPAMFLALVGDLLIANGGLNLTTELARIEPPAWYTASAGPQRVYIGGRVRGFMNTADRDATPAWQIPADSSAIEGRMELNANLPMAPSGWRVREALSYDLPYLWPAEYEATVRRFEQADAAERAAFLRRAGVRRCVLPLTEPRQFRVVAEVPDWNMRVFECDPGASRAIVPSSVEISREPADLTWQREALFDPALSDDVARLPAMPVTSAAAGRPELPAARIVQDGGTRVVVEASAQHAGVLVLRDSYDPSWTAEVDGVPSAIVRANGLYRAVALPPGRHVIRFSYRPRDLATGLIISGMTFVFLTLSLGVSRRSGRRRGPADAGFTLIELMVVLAIIAVLLAIAFNQYRGMQARGNEVSALASMRSIATAQWQFALTCGHMKYASTLPALGKPVPSTGEGFLSPDLTQAEAFEKSGYKFQMTATPIDSGVPACNGTVPADGYAATADPIHPGVTGVNYYGINADRILYLDDQQTFKDNLPESGLAKHGEELK